MSARRHAERTHFCYLTRKNRLTGKREKLLIPMEWGAYVVLFRPGSYYHREGSRRTRRTSRRGSQRGTGGLNRGLTKKTWLHLSFFGDVFKPDRLNLFQYRHGSGIVSNYRRTLLIMSAKGQWRPRHYERICLCGASHSLNVKICS